MSSRLKVWGVGQVGCDVLILERETNICKGQKNHNNFNVPNRSISEYEPNPILIIKTHILTPERHTNNFESLDKNSVRIVEARVVKLYSTLIEAFKEAC